MPITKSRRTTRVEYGDFQTPPALARDVCRTLAKLIVAPASVLEPTCGRGSLLEAAAEEFPSARHVLGFDVNANHVAWATQQLERFRLQMDVSVEESDFFHADWPERLRRLADPLLIIGNPPWVTNSALGGLSSDNLPAKRNSQGLCGIDALTGKSNFDISEWMMLRFVEWMRGREATMAMLCKTTVARKVLLRGWAEGAAWSDARLYGIDAQQHFGASVNACLLVIRQRDGGRTGEQVATVYPTLSSRELVGTDLVQAIPLVLAAAIGHILWGHLELDLTTSLLIGAVPGVFVGAHVSSRAPDGLIRPVLAAILFLTALKLLGLSDTGLAAAASACAVVGIVAVVRILRNRAASISVRSRPG